MGRVAGSALLRPHYREWVFVGAGLGMTYQPQSDSQPRPQMFTNVFVNPSSYRSFMRSGTWPDKTILILEIRASDSEVSINKSGRFQTDLPGWKRTSRIHDFWRRVGVFQSRPQRSTSGGAFW